MIKRIVFLFPVVLFAAIALPTANSSNLTLRTHDPDGVVAHEWGTFTTVAGQDGRSIEWLPLSGQSDLPCFVDRLKQILVKGLWNETAPIDYAAARASLWGKVRMETPVIYFYSPQQAVVNVRVTFSRGLMTEWYPRATVTQPRVHPGALADPALASAIEWKNVSIMPAAKPTLPRESGGSHYYAARDTDAAPIQVGSQVEKFLFYRGVAGFDVPLSAVARADGTIHVRNLGVDPIDGVIVFENRGGRIGYRRLGTLRSDADVAQPELSADFDALRADLVRTLAQAGLFPREAEAMVETWRDSWFEEGVRVLYLMPRPTVDAILPLAIEPAPRRVERAFVGRMEVITPGMITAVDQAIAQRDGATVSRYARFLGPITERLLASPSTASSADIKRATNAAFAKYASATRMCQ